MSVKPGMTIFFIVAVVIVVARVLGLSSRLEVHPRRIIPRLPGIDSRERQ
jgi:hypothetical protein